MNALEFYMANLGRHLLADKLEVSEEPLSLDQLISAVDATFSTYFPTGKVRENGTATNSRIVAGWAIIRPGGTVWKTGQTCAGIESSDLTMSEAYAAELKIWDGKEPRLFVQFGKKLLYAKDLFLTVDKRFVRLCTPNGVLDQNWVETPPVAKARKEPSETPDPNSSKARKGLRRK